MNSGPSGHVLAEIFGVGASDATAPRPLLALSHRAVEERLAAIDRPAILVVAAPAGTGKTSTLLAALARDGRPIAWVTVPEGGVTPSELVRLVAVALSTVGPLEETTLTSLLDGGQDPSRAVALLQNAAAELPPFVLVVDDVHEMHDATSRSVLGRILGGAPASCDLVLAGRREPELRLDRLATARRVVRLGATELQWPNALIAQYAAGSGLALDDATLEAVRIRTEGWAAAIVRIVDDMVSHGPSAIEQVPASLDKMVRDELELRTTVAERHVLERSSILTELHGPLCDCTVQTTGSGALLARLADQGDLHITEVIGRPGWYRLHPLARDILQAALASAAPESIPPLHRRASAWYEAHGNRPGAVRHARDAGDQREAADLVFRDSFALSTTGRNEELATLLELFSDEERRSSAPLCLAQATRLLADLDADGALVWVDRAAGAPAVGPLSDGTPTVRIATGVLQALMGNEPGPVLLKRLQPVLDLPAAVSPLVVVGHVLAATVTWMLGRSREAADLLHLAEPGWSAVPLMRAVALSYLAFIAAEDGDAEATWSFHEQALRTVSLEHLAQNPMLYNPRLMLAVLDARRVEHAGSPDGPAHGDTSIDEVFGHNAPRARLLAFTLLAELDLLLGDDRHARRRLDDSEPLARRESWAKAILLRRQALEEALDHRALIAHGLAELGPIQLSPAEQRVLSFLPTHLSLREVADATHRSVHTIRSQVLSIYRKLDVETRSDAVERARALGLLPR